MRRLAALYAAFGLIACATQPSPSRSAAASTPPSTQPPAVRPQEPALQVDLRQALAAVSRVRGLPVLRPVKGFSQDRAALAAKLGRKVQTEIPREVVIGQAELLRAFGAIPVDFDFEKGVLSLLQQQLAGYYDEHEDAMFLLSDLAPDEAEATLAHELVHALQDQHFNLDQYSGHHPDGGDRDSAIQCLAEGDATSAMLDYVMAESGGDATQLPDMALDLQVAAGMAFAGDMASFPAALRTSLVAPYLDGIRFVHALRRKGGWPEVNRAWKNPPVSTEQVLHFDKYLAHEPPDDVTPPKAPDPSGWTKLYTDVFGEQSLRILFEDWMPKGSAILASSNWGGDRVVVYKRESQPNSYAAAIHIRYDRTGFNPGTIDHAAKAADVIVRAWKSSFSKGRSACKSGSGGTPVALCVVGSSIGLVAGQLGSCPRSEQWACAVAAQ